jgi:hypothetical protein
MSKLTKKQRKMQEMLEGFVQPSSAVDAIKKLQEISKEVSKYFFPLFILINLLW